MADQETQVKTRKQDGEDRVTSKRAGEIAADSTTAVQESDGGITIIHDDVVSKIASRAVQEVQGVHRLVPQGTGQRVAALAQSVTGSDAGASEQGVAVEVGKEETAVDVRIVTEYGASIPQISEAIRRNLSDRVESMTGLRVVEANIEVVDLHFPEQQQNQRQQKEESRVQ